MVRRLILAVLLVVAAVCPEDFAANNAYSAAAYADCAACRGTGNGSFACSLCKGTGSVNKVTCGTCNGKGRSKCGACGGSGKK